MWKPTCDILYSLLHRLNTYLVSIEYDRVQVRCMTVYHVPLLIGAQAVKRDHDRSAVNVSSECYVNLWRT